MSQPEDFEAGALDLSERIPAMEDAELLAAYQRTSGEAGDPVADALLVEIERRGLDI